MSWGVEMITLIQEGGEDRAMAFNVNGNHFKGTIILSVNGADLYEIRFMQGGEIINDMTLEDVYVDEVIDLIDERIEKIPSYKR